MTDRYEIGTDTFFIDLFWLLLMDVYGTTLITAFMASTPHRHPWLLAAYIPSMGIKKATDLQWPFGVY